MKTLALSVLCLCALASPALAVPDLQVFRSAGQQSVAVPDDSVDDIGDVTIGPATVLYQVRNQGDTTLVIANGVSLEGAVNGGCSVITQPDVVIMGGNISTFSIEIRPEGPGSAYSCNLVIFSDDPDQPYKFTLAATITPAGSPDFHIVGGATFVEGSPMFGVDTFIGDAVGVPTTRGFSITNVGTGTLEISEVVVDGTIHCDCEPTLVGTSLQAGDEPGALTVVVTRQRLDAGFQCDLRISSNDPDQPEYQLKLTDEGPRLLVREVAPFGVLDLGGTNSTGLNVENVGSRALENIVVRLDGAGSFEGGANCSLIPQFGSTLAVGEVGEMNFFAAEGVRFQCAYVIESNDPARPTYSFVIEGNERVGSGSGICSVGADGGMLLALVLGVLLVRGRARTRSYVSPRRTPS